MMLVHHIKLPSFDPWVGKFPGEGNGNPLQYCCLENPMDGTPLASRVAQGVSGPSSSCVWNPRVFADDARVPLAVVLPPPARGAGTLIPSAQRLVWAAKQALGKAALGALFA